MLNENGKLICPICDDEVGAKLVNMCYTCFRNWEERHMRKWLAESRRILERVKHERKLNGG